MEIELRDTTEADLPAIFRIRKDPLVVPHQFRLSQSDNIAFLSKHLFPRGRAAKRPAFRCSTIWQDGEIIGHVFHLHQSWFGKPYCSCGWNLAPAQWGRGIMCAALSQLFDSFFREQGIEMVIADCFSTNARCQRLLEKLRFTPAQLPVLTRLRFALNYQCGHWICRYELTRDRWRAGVGQATRLPDEKDNCPVAGETPAPRKMPSGGMN
jgi:RimJ/RimL family protein N-acetyltransferase